MTKKEITNHERLKDNVRPEFKKKGKDSSRRGITPDFTEA
jgi:hypothetical protein